MRTLAALAVGAAIGGAVVWALTADDRKRLADYDKRRKSDRARFRRANEERRADEVRRLDRMTPEQRRDYWTRMAVSRADRPKPTSRFGG